MLIKILITLAIIAAVAMTIRLKTAARKQKRATKAAPKEEEESDALPVKTVTCLIVGVLIAVAALIFFFKYQSDNRIIKIRVITEDGTSIVYQAKQKEIKGRQFRTLDDKQITLSESERIEIDDP